MKLTRLFVAMAVVLAGCTSTPPERAIIDDAARALGGAAQIQAINSIVMEGAGENTNFGQSLSPDSLQTFNVTQFKRSIDFANRRARLEQTRVATFGVNPQPQVQISGLDGAVAYNIAANGTATRAAEQAVRDRRLEMHHHPIGAIRAALAAGAQLSNARKEGNYDLVDITTADRDTLTLYVDSGTKLPSKVVSVTANNANWPLGDAAIETSFSNYTDAGGLKFPERIASKTDRYTTAAIQVSKNIVNGAGDLSAPEAARAAAAPTPATPIVTAEQVAAGIWRLAGQSHHSVLVEFADYMALIEAPQSELRTSAVIDKVKELKPDKPLRYIVNTHHHFDHSGGIRRAMAEEGVTIITHAGNKAFYEEMAKRPATLYPDALSRSPKNPAIEGLTEKFELKDATRTMEIHHVPNTHSDTMLMVYFPAERILVEGDLYTPPAPNTPPPAAGFPFAGSVVSAVEKLGLRVDRIVPIHGSIVPYRSLVAAARPASS